MAEELLEIDQPNSSLMSFILEISDVFTNPTEHWENTVENAISMIGNYLGLDQVESMIKSLDKRQKAMINWYHDSDDKRRNLIKEEGELINFLFKNRTDNLFYFRNIDKQTPPQLKKLLRIKRLKSAVILNLNYGRKKLGYITLGFCEESNLNGDDLKLIKTFAAMSSNFIALQQQSLTIKKLVEKNSEQDRRLKEFAFITSHHLRAFSSNLASLTEYLLINPNEQRFIEMISNSVKKLNGSIEDINGILTHENDLISEELSKVKVSDVIKKIIEWHRKAIKVNEIEVENLLPKRLSIYSQLEMLENIFSHIFSNAIKYGTNQKAKRIRIDHSENEDYLIVRVRDFGDGIDMKKYGSKLFKAGSRFSNNSNANLGMGLFLSKYQIQKIGGRIHLKSEPGKGTSVQCYLPVK
ncbi:HAMP domain-containing sensor histidine kinase [Ekhidna sp.]|uniref:sensor histidine kinase n=1 Tax=Ekhidna sp. TaxID=2608089 RepID=UPI00329A5EE7